MSQPVFFFGFFAAKWCVKYQKLISRSLDLHPVRLAMLYTVTTWGLADANKTWLMSWREEDMRPCCVVFIFLLTRSLPLSLSLSLSLITGKKSLMHFSGNCSFLGFASRLAECFVFFASKKVQETKKSSTRSRDKWRFFQLYDSDDDMKRDCKHDNLMRWVDIGLQSAVESDVSYNDPVSLTRARQGGVSPFHMKWNEITQGFLSKQGTLGPKLIETNC